VEHEHGDDEDGGVVPTTEHVPTTSMMIENGPSPTPTTTNPDVGDQFPSTKNTCYVMV
jgi:hypothetical protein